MVYPITAHSMAHQRDADGGFVLEATTMMDPIGFATSVEDESGPLWGDALVETLRGTAAGSASSRWRTTTTTAASPWVRTASSPSRPRSTEVELARTGAALDFSRDVLRAAGASSIKWTGLISSHVQGTCRMGSDPERSVVDADSQSWDVSRLYVGDGSVTPRTLSVNPSLTFMALAHRLAAHLDADPHGYLS